MCTRSTVDNPDLSPPGEPLELDTPQALFESFLRTAEQGEWRRLASAGVTGLIIAFAARRVLGDIMASLQIAFARTARIGGRV